MGRKGNRVWVDGLEYASLNAAAEVMDMKSSTLSKALKFGAFTLRGHSISETAPKKKPEAKALKEAPKPAEPKRLLRYPPGKTPCDIGIGVKWR